MKQWWLMWMLGVIMTYGETCKKYQCATRRLPERYNGRPSCAWVDEHGRNVFVVPCAEEHMSCPFDPELQFGECTSINLTKSARFPGETCSSNDECLTSICVQQVCKGAELDESCGVDSDCDAGLSCQVTNRCAQVQQEGQLCSEDMDCASYLHCINSTCTTYGSLEVGTYFTVSETKWAGTAKFMCQSGEAELLPQQRRDSSSLVYACKKGSVFQKKNATHCFYHDRDENKIVIVPAECGLSPSGNTTCPLHNLDINYANTFREFIEYLTEVKPSCSVAFAREEDEHSFLEKPAVALMRKFFCRNEHQLSYFNRLKKSFVRYLFPKNSVYLDNMDNCTETMVNSLFFENGEPPSYAYLSASVGTTALLFLVFLVLF